MVNKPPPPVHDQGQIQDFWKGSSILFLALQAKKKGGGVQEGVQLWA